MKVLKIPTILHLDDAKLPGLDKLIDNALKFTEQGSVTLKDHYFVEDKKFTFFISIIDTGIGIPEDYIEKYLKNLFKCTQILGLNMEALV